MQRVALSLAESSQRTAAPGFDGSSWPVSRTTEELCNRWVRGMPAYAAAARADVTPGTISNAIPAEHERIPPLQPNDVLSPQRQPDQGLVDLILGAAELSALLPGKNALAPRRRQVEHLGRDQVVVHDGVGLAQDAPGLEREQFRIPGPGADKVHGSWAHMSAPGPAWSAGRARARAICVSLSIESFAASRSVLISRSGERGASYGESIPVNCWIRPARAFL